MVLEFAQWRREALAGTFGEAAGVVERGNAKRLRQKNAKLRRGSNGKDNAPAETTALLALQAQGIDPEVLGQPAVGGERLIVEALRQVAPRTLCPCIGGARGLTWIIRGRGGWP